MLLAGLSFVAAALTCTMFSSKQAMLGFPCAIAWFITGGQAYTLSTVPWGDIYYYVFFASAVGMGPFCAIAAFSLRTKKEERQVGEGFIDEGRDEARSTEDTGEPEPVNSPPSSDQPSRRVRVVRERAERRREQGVSARTNYGEFK